MRLFTSSPVWPLYRPNDQGSVAKQGPAINASTTVPTPPADQRLDPAPDDVCAEDARNMAGSVYPSHSPFTGQADHLRTRLRQKLKMIVATLSRSITIKVDAAQFMEDGFLILRNVIDPGQFAALRSGVEILVQRKWPDGIPDGHFQPMMGVRDYVDESTGHVMELLLQENMLGVARQLMPRAGFVAPAYTFMILNPLTDKGPWFWHRDMNPPREGPLQGLQEDFMANGPAVLQMNIAVYDDKVLWVVPGSHKRPNTDAENAQLASVPHGYGHRQ